MSKLVRVRWVGLSVLLVVACGDAGTASNLVDDDVPLELPESQAGAGGAAVGGSGAAGSVAAGSGGSIVGVEAGAGGAGSGGAGSGGAGAGGAGSGGAGSGGAGSGGTAGVGGAVAGSGGAGSSAAGAAGTVGGAGGNGGAGAGSAGSAAERTAHAPFCRIPEVPKLTQLLWGCDDLVAYRGTSKRFATLTYDGDDPTTVYLNSCNSFGAPSDAVHPYIPCIVGTKCTLGLYDGVSVTDNYNGTCER